MFLILEDKTGRNIINLSKLVFAWEEQEGDDYQINLQFYAETENTLSYSSESKKDKDFQKLLEALDDFSKIDNIKDYLLS